jgi:hypothetical protein
VERADRRLKLVQERLRELICAPSGVAAALAAEGDATGAGLAALLRGDARASATARLEVYADAYFERLLGVLRDDYPALAAALGDDAFHDLATAYLAAHPPSRPSLRDAGARVAELLAGDSGEAAFFRVRWPFAADLAALEWALVDAFDAPDAPALSREGLAALAPEAWEELPLRLHPATSLLELAWPVHLLRESHERGEPLPAAGLSREPTHICVTRRHERVFFRAVEPFEAALLATLQGGTTFGALCAHIAEERGAAAAPAFAATLLTRWLEAGTVLSS